MKFFVCVLFVLAVFVNLWTLKDGHNWGDDFAQYIINARNIVEGKPFMSGVMLENAVVYPPGLPLLIAPVLKAFGLNFKILKLLNVFFWYLSVAVLYVLFLRTAGRPFALMAALFLAFSSFFFVYKQNVLSDVPFFFFVCASLYAFEHRRDMAFLLSMSAALWTRSAGIALFAAALFYFIFIRRDQRTVIVVLTVLVVNEFVLFFWLGWHPGFLTVVWQGTGVFLYNVFNNFATVFRSLWYFFCPDQTIFSRCLFNTMDPLIGLAAPFFYLTMVWSFIRGFRKKSLSYLECFSFFYISMLIIESGFSQPPAAFTRFIFPLLPFAFAGSRRLLSSLERFKFGFSQAARVAFLVLLLINVTNVIINRDFNDDVFNFPVNSELVNWVKQNMKPEERFMFFRPRALALLTGREGTAPWLSPGQRPLFFQRVRDYKISYVLSTKDNDPNGLAAQLEKSSQFRLVWENRGYEIFKFIHA